MKVTCAVALSDVYGRILIGHATNQTIWSLPKGVAELDEAHDAAAARELFEETGLDYVSNERYKDFVDCGEHKYLPGKNLHLFIEHIPWTLAPSDVHCNSMFDWNGTQTPEFDAFVWADKDALRHLLFPKQMAILEKFV